LEPSAAPEADGPPTDGVILLVGLLVLGLTLGVRAVRARQSAVGVSLLVYCAAFLVVLGAVLAGVAVAAPSAPTALTAVADAPDRVTLHWSSAPDEVPVVAWRVLRDDVAIADLPPEVTTHSDTGLRPGVTYRYAVRPLDAPPGELGATTSVRTPPVVPVAPLPVLGLRAVAQGRRVGGLVADAAVANATGRGRRASARSGARGAPRRPGPAPRARDAGGGPPRLRTPRALRRLDRRRCRTAV
jgi:hypothetical protein